MDREPARPLRNKPPAPRLAALASSIAIALLSACSGDPHASSSGPSASTAAASAPGSSASAPAFATAPPPAAAKADPDPKHGAELAAKFECWRCHDGLGMASPIPLPDLPAEATTATDAAKPDNKNCYHCHAAILDGRYQAPKPATTTRWKKNVEALRDVPSLTGAHRRFRRSWVEAFLLQPHDLRPRLAPTMPRLALTAADARDLAAWLVPKPDPESAASAIPKEAVAEGRDLFQKKGCPSCHVMSGAAPIKGTAPAKPGEHGLSAAMRLAPDLRFTRDRMRLDTIVKWIKNPALVKVDALMPQTPLTDDEATKLASFVAFEALAPEEPKKPPSRLPVLTRHVSYEEVKARVFNKICWHCHSDADYAIGDGGPGNTGGFGFAPRGLNLAAYDGILSGSLDDKGERRSIFEPMADGTPRLVAALVARWGEEAGHEDAAIRGMPLGLPSLSPEDLQLVDSWVAQGHSPD